MLVPLASDYQGGGNFPANVLTYSCQGHTCAPSNQIHIAHAPETSGLTDTTSYLDATPLSQTVITGHPSQKQFPSPASLLQNTPGPD